MDVNSFQNSKIANSSVASKLAFGYGKGQRGRLALGNFRLQDSKTTQQNLVNMRMGSVSPKHKQSVKSQMSMAGERGGGGGASIHSKGVVNNLGVRKLPAQYLSVEKTTISPRGEGEQKQSARGKGESQSPPRTERNNEKSRSHSIDLGESKEEREEKSNSYENGPDGFGVRKSSKHRDVTLLSEEERRLAYPRKWSDDNVTLVGNRDAKLETTATGFFKNKTLVKEQLNLEERLNKKTENEKAKRE